MALRRARIPSLRPTDALLLQTYRYAYIYVYTFYFKMKTEALIIVCLYCRANWYLCSPIQSLPLFPRPSQPYQHPGHQNYHIQHWNNKLRVKRKIKNLKLNFFCYRYWWCNWEWLRTQKQPSTLSTDGLLYGGNFSTVDVWVKNGCLKPSQNYRKKNLGTLEAKHWQQQQKKADKSSEAAVSNAVLEVIGFKEEEKQIDRQQV